MDTIATDAPKMSGCPADADAATMLAQASLIDPMISARPTAFYAALRAGDPVHYDPKLEMYLVARFEEMQIVLRDPQTFSMEHGYKEQYGKGFAAELKDILIRDGGGFFPDAIMTDPPYHTRIRSLMEGAFTAHRVKQLEPLITKLIVDIIDRIADRGLADGVSDIAVPITIAVICEQLGLEHAFAHKIHRWSHAVTQQIGRMQNREQMLEHAREICELQNYLIACMREREAAPREDMISDLVHATLEDGTKLSFMEAVSLVRALLVAGNETTATAMANLLYILATQPDVAQQLHTAVDDHRLLSRFVEELLRIEAPVRGLSRMTTKEVELGGKTLPAGAHMLLLYASANDDPNEFACPRNFDMTRGNMGRHLSFGAGVHRCIGLSLARMEIKVAAREIVRRLADLKLTISPDEVTYLPTVATHSIAHLPLTFTRRL